MDQRQKWIISANIRHFEDRLKTETDSAKQALLQQLLAEHITQLNGADEDTEVDRAGFAGGRLV